MILSIRSKLSAHLSACLLKWLRTMVGFHWNMACGVDAVALDKRWGRWMCASFVLFCVPLLQVDFEEVGEMSRPFAPQFALPVNLHQSFIGTALSCLPFATVENSLPDFVAASLTAPGIKCAYLCVVDAFLWVMSVWTVAKSTPLDTSQRRKVVPQSMKAEILRYASLFFHAFPCVPYRRISNASAPERWEIQSCTILPSLEEFPWLPGLPGQFQSCFPSDPAG